MKQDNNLLILPLRDIDGKIWSLQAIDENGIKRYQKGGKKSGCFHLIGEFNINQPTIVVEGYATGASIHEATGLPVVVAFDSGNLVEVASAIHNKGLSPMGQVIASDDDRFLKCPVAWTNGKYTHSNPLINEGALPNSGKESAMIAAEAVNGVVAFPEFHEKDYVSTDFNDIHKTQGLKAVRIMIREALTELPLNLNQSKKLVEFAR